MPKWGELSHIRFATHRFCTNTETNMQIPMNIHTEVYTDCPIQLNAIPTPENSTDSLLNNMLFETYNQEKMQFLPNLHCPNGLDRESLLTQCLWARASLRVFQLSLLNQVGGKLCCAYTHTKKLPGSNSSAFIFVSLLTHKRN